MHGRLGLRNGWVALAGIFGLYISLFCGHDFGFSFSVSIMGKKCHLSPQRCMTMPNDFDDGPTYQLHRKYQTRLLYRDNGVQISANFGLLTRVTDFNSRVHRSFNGILTSESKNVLFCLHYTQ